MTDPTRSASTLVRNVIERDGVVRHGLSRGLINAHALARSIQLANPRAASFDAILSAIRRYAPNDVSEKRNTSAKLIHKLTMKNHVTVLSIRNQPEVQLTIARFAAEVDYTHGETFRVVIAPKTLSVTADSKNANKLASSIPKARVVKQTENLAELDVDMTADADSTAGTISAVTTELAINDVNIIQLSTVGPGHILILVDERNATNAYEALEGM
jgi:hypothetical protein